MRPRLNTIWLALITLAGLFSLAFLWFTLFPGEISSEARLYFSIDQITQGREYNQAIQMIFIGSFLAEALFLIWFIFGSQGMHLNTLTRYLTGSNYWGNILKFFLSMWLALRIINLPFALYGGYFLQHRWGFSTENMASWWMDYFKGAGLDLILSATGALLLFWIMRRWKTSWWLAGAAFISIWIVIQTLIWPVMVSPIFNHFSPATDPKIVNMVHHLSEKAGLPVGQVLVMDASRRTTKANAYFTGIGPTKRIVLYDTLLSNYPLDQVEAVVAHEMAHWHQGHLFKGLSLGIVGSFFVWGFVFLLLKKTVKTSTSQPPPHIWAIILLIFLLISFVGGPVENYISRGMEKEADQIAVSLTGDIPAIINLQTNLAARNLSEVSPPAFIQWFSYSNPPALIRIKNIIRATNPNQN